METNFKDVQKELKKHDSDIAREALNILFVLVIAPESEEEAEYLCNSFLPERVYVSKSNYKKNFKILDPFFEELLNLIDKIMNNFNDMVNDKDKPEELSESMEEMVNLLKNYNTLSKKEFLELSLDTAMGTMDAFDDKFGDFVSELTDNSAEMREFFNFIDFLKEDLDSHKAKLKNEKITENKYHAVIEKVCVLMFNLVILSNIMIIMFKEDFEFDYEGNELDEESVFDPFDDDEDIHDVEPIFDPYDNRAFELKFKLMHYSPEVYRTLVIPAGYNLDTLHHIIQDIFEWDNMHLHEFIKNKKRYSMNPDSTYDDDYSNQVFLSEVFKRKGSKIKYMYDFGDSWLIEISVLKTHKNMEKPYPVCIDAYGTSPEEDSGGIMGYMDMIDEEELAENEYDIKGINRVLKDSYKNIFDKYK